MSEDELANEYLNIFEFAWQDFKEEISNGIYTPDDEEDIKCYLFSKIDQRWPLDIPKDLHSEFRWRDEENDSVRADIMMGDKIAIEIKKINWSGTDTTNSWEDREKRVLDDVKKLRTQIKTKNAIFGCMVIVCGNYEESHEKYYKKYKEECMKEPIIRFYKVCSLQISRAKIERLNVKVTNLICPHEIVYEGQNGFVVEMKKAKCYLAIKTYVLKSGRRHDDLRQYGLRELDRAKRHVDR